MNLKIKGENTFLTLFSNQCKHAERMMQYSICTYFLPSLLASEQALQTRMRQLTEQQESFCVCRANRGKGRVSFFALLPLQMTCTLHLLPFPRATKTNYAYLQAKERGKYESWEKKEEGTGAGRGEKICHSSSSSLLPFQPLHQKHTPPKSFQKLSVCRLLLYFHGLPMSILKEISNSTLWYL